ncbi:MAG: glycosyltransferase family 2 protein [Elusimicrobiota bacterium]|jgi:glycosyltransferase involved in cell wall biosynthesis|nr:glycosyltransferase family 2 protein [Elusimicrobiota bacterium]
MKTSAYIIVKNAERHIKDCIKSLIFADEIIVVDDFSSDKTAEFAESLGARVIKHKFENFGAQRNFALSCLSYNWVICLDADERISDKLRGEILEQIKDKPCADIFLAPRKTMFIDKWIMHSGWYPDYRHPILFDKNKAVYKNQSVHEDIDYRGGKKFYFKGDILHYSYSGIKNFIQKSDFYTDLSAAQMYEQGKRFHFYNLIINPLNMFLKMFILKKGFLDGIAGFILAMLYSFFYTALKYIKLWELQSKNKKVLKEKSE